MSDNEIRYLYRELEEFYPDGGYVSRATIFKKALHDHKITKEAYEEAREYYGSLWTYVGD